MGMEKKLRNSSRRRTPWDEKEQRTAMQEFLYQEYKDRYEHCHPVLTETGEAELINSFIPEECPYCSGKRYKRYGKTRNGVQRYRCQLCGQTFNPITKTIFDGHKISISEWIDYTLNILRYVSISADSWNSRNAITTSRYWLEKLFFDTGRVPKRHSIIRTGMVRRNLLSGTDGRYHIYIILRREPALPFKIISPKVPYSFTIKTMLTKN